MTNDASVPPKSTQPPSPSPAPAPAPAAAPASTARAGPTVEKVQSVLKTCLNNKKFAHVPQIAHLFASGFIRYDAKAVTALNLLIQCYEATSEQQYAAYFRKRLGDIERTLPLRAPTPPPEPQPAPSAPTPVPPRGSTPSTRADNAGTSAGRDTRTHNIPLSSRDDLEDEDVARGTYTTRLEEIIQKRPGTHDFALALNKDAQWRTFWPCSTVAKASVTIFLAAGEKVRRLLKATVISASGTVPCSSASSRDAPRHQGDVVADARNIAAKHVLRKLASLIARLETVARERLATEMDDLCERWIKKRQLDTRHQTALFNARRLLEVAEDGFLVGGVVYAYGSATNWLSLWDSDLDVSVQLPGIRPLREEFNGKLSRITCLEMLRSVAEDEGMRNITLVKKARVPVLKYYDGEADMRVDMTIGNDDSILMSRLIRRHVMEDERVWQLCMVVKYWARRRDICGAAAGFLNPMSWVLMVIFFLQHVAKPRVAALFGIEDNGKRHDVHEAVIVRIPWKFHTGDIPVASAPAAGSAAGSAGIRRAEKRTSDLLTEFFVFFGREFDFAHEVVSIQMQCRKGLKLDGPRSSVVFIEQPLRFGDNVVSYVNEGSMKLTLFELQRAAANCLAQGDLREVCKRRSADELRG